MAGLIERTPAGQVFAAQFVPDPHAHRRRVWSRASLAKSFDGLGGGRDARGTHFVRIAPWRGPRHHHGVRGQAPALFPAELKALRFQASSCGYWVATSDTAAGIGDAIRKTMRRFFVNPLVWKQYPHLAKATERGFSTRSPVPKHKSAGTCGHRSPSRVAAG